MTPLHHDLLKEFRSLAASATSTSGTSTSGTSTSATSTSATSTSATSTNAAGGKLLMERIAQRLHEKMTKFNWVGFYLADPADPGALQVGPFVGSFTPHARIPLSTGLCGAAASSGQVVVVQDVSKDPRYLAGSPLVKSEIVVPIFVRKKLAAELDIDSYFVETFNKTEQEFVEACAQIVAEYLAKSPL